MARRLIHITGDDARKLEELLRRGLRQGGPDMENLRVLQKELMRARIVRPHEVAPDVVTMHSCVRLKDLRANDVRVMTLVFPEEADFDNGLISVVAPIGAAILGYRVGDTVKLQAPGGPRMLYIEQVLYQPEAAGRADS